MHFNQLQEALDKRWLTANHGVLYARVSLDQLQQTPPIQLVFLAVKPLSFAPSSSEILTGNVAGKSDLGMKSTASVGPW